MLYTPAYHVDTDTAPAGTEWVLDGNPLRVTSMRSNQGHTPIPPKGFVLSFGGVSPPEPIAQIEEGIAVVLESHWKSTFGVSSADLDRADHIVNGAGLLRRAGISLTNWSVESLSHESFVDARHPRTLIGADAEGFIWLGVVDGRQADSIGMTFADLQRLCEKLHLTDALNLDGGGSTTMVVKGRVVNRPSDAIGPRPVSDALLVTSRQ
jgi:exopolysaccharide biosynthesis protein